jgi:hypothetical protein
MALQTNTVHLISLTPNRHKVNSDPASLRKANMDLAKDRIILVSRSSNNMDRINRLQGDTVLDPHHKSNMVSHHQEATHLRDSINHHLHTKPPQVVMVHLRAAAIPVSRIRINNLKTNSKDKVNILAKGIINNLDGNL